MRAITDCSSLSQDDKGLAEAHAGDGEVHGADDRHDEELGPDDIEAGRPIENGLGEADEMRRGKDLHGVLQPDRHAFPRRRRAGTNCMGSSVRTRSSANCGMDSANVAKAIPTVTVRAGTASLKCQALDRRSG